MRSVITFWLFSSTTSKGSSLDVHKFAVFNSSLQIKLCIALLSIRQVVLAPLICIFTAKKQWEPVYSIVAHYCYFKIKQFQNSTQIRPIFFNILLNSFSETNWFQEAHQDSCQTFNTECFAKILNSYITLTLLQNAPS